MATVTLISPATGGSTSAVISTMNYERFYLVASGLATTETAIPNLISPDGIATTPLIDTTGVYTGLTASANNRVFYGGPDITVTKSATAASVGVYLIPVGDGD